MFGPSVAQGTSPTSAIGDAMVGSSAGANADAMQADLMALRQSVMQINSQVESLAQERPALAPIMAQIADLLKAAVIAGAKAGVQQTASGLAVPSGGVTA